MRTITGMGITLRMVTNMITRVVPLTATALGITRTCTIGIVSPFTDAVITAAATATPIRDHPGTDLISDVLPFGRHATGYAVTSVDHRCHDSRLRCLVAARSDQAMGSGMILRVNRADGSSA